jgi:hypothetical protein
LPTVTAWRTFQSWTRANCLRVLSVECHPLPFLGETADLLFLLGCPFGDVCVCVCVCACVCEARQPTSVCRRCCHCDGCRCCCTRCGRQQRPLVPMPWSAPAASICERNVTLLVSRHPDSYIFRPASRASVRARRQGKASDRPLLAMGRPYRINCCLRAALHGESRPAHRTSPAVCSASSPILPAACNSFQSRPTAPLRFLSVRQPPVLCGRRVCVTMRAVICRLLRVVVTASLIVGCRRGWFGTCAPWHRDALIVFVRGGCGSRPKRRLGADRKVTNGPLPCGSSPARLCRPPVSGWNSARRLAVRDNRLERRRSLDLPTFSVDFACRCSSLQPKLPCRQSRPAEGQQLTGEEEQSRTLLDDRPLPDHCRRAPPLPLSISHP